MERKPIIKEDLNNLLGLLYKNIPPIGRHFICSKNIYNKYFITKLPRKLKKKNKKLGILNLSINYIPKNPAKNIVVNIGFNKP